VLLPFWGEWTITQAHHGEHTHIDQWAHAWDFEIKDENEQSFKNSGNKREDYYCFNRPVIAPADGTIEEIVDFVEDNEIGDMNLDYNWGNTIVIKHHDKLFTKLSHLKQGSFKVKKGDTVKKGDMLANCGNSGRSPEPHLHFQVQDTPFIGSKTLDYPIGYYVLNSKDGFKFKSFDKPVKDDRVSNIEKNITLHNAFHFVPGQQIRIEIIGLNKTVSWDVKADIYNHTFLECSATRSKAWFKNDGNIHRFTHFEGNKKSMLFHFYLAAYKVSNGFYKNMVISDTFPINTFSNKGMIVLQDVIAPFYIFIHVEYSLKFIRLKDYLSDSNILFTSTAHLKYGKKAVRKINYEFEIEKNRIKKFVIVDGDKTIEAREVSTT
jgi:murein DD-endopeptidase MepM/ murein hydrolase activator NlpD